MTSEMCRQPLNDAQPGPESTGITRGTPLESATFFDGSWTLQHFSFTCNGGIRPDAPLEIPKQ